MSTDASCCSEADAGCLRAEDQLAFRKPEAEDDAPVQIQKLKDAAAEINPEFLTIGGILSSVRAVTASSMTHEAKSC